MCIKKNQTILINFKKFTKQFANDQNCSRSWNEFQEENRPST